MKKLLAGLLCLTLLVSPVYVYADDTAQAQEPTQAAEAPALTEADVPYGYIPIRNAVEVTKGEMGFSDGATTLTVGDDTYAFTVGNKMAVKNGSPIELLSPPMTVLDTMYVTYDDVSFLFETRGEAYGKTKKTAVTSAYYYMRLFQIPSVSMAIVDSVQKYEWTQAFGYKNLETKEVPTSKTTYSLASISKVFTAMSVMKLVEQNKLNLDEKVIKYLPDEFKVNKHPVYGGDYRDITLRMLLTHMSGIPGDTFEGFYSLENYNKSYMENFLKNLSKDYMDNKTEQEMSYANNGYTILGIIVARQSGYTGDFDGFVKYTEENLFKKMGMKLSTFKINSTVLLELASSYQASSLPVEPHYLCNAIPAGGLYSNAEDMTRFMNFMLNGGVYDNVKVVENYTINDMTSPTSFDMSMSPSIKMNLGTYTTQYGNLKAVGHGGNIEHFNSDMQLSMKDKLGVFVTSNSTSSLQAMPNLSILTLSKMVEEKTGVVNLGYPTQDRVPQAVIATADVMAKAAGYYTNVGKITVTDDLKLFIPVLGMEFYLRDDGSYYNDSLDAIWFERVGLKEVIYLGANKMSILGEKIQPEKITGDFELFTGTYTSTYNPPGDVDIVNSATIGINEDGYATFSFTTPNGQTSTVNIIQRVDNNTFYIMGTGRNLGKVIKLYKGAGSTYLDVFGMNFIRQ